VYLEDTSENRADVVVVVTLFNHNFVNCKATLIWSLKIYEIKYNISLNDVIGGSRIFLEGVTWEPERAKQASIEGVWAYGRMKFERL